ncbi:KRAB-A domain-containing protein 2 [Frankliniella fusca]|uniref:KRAB-A domain-containing protein 2 n=1 Tax=Frankliniella fusca TaxID=407009 RepID=A0AAE1GV54_9NEOP|nr:KRAB-A domain-containing protein 2 [Frankliniella fusca]
MSGPQPPNRRIFEEKLAEILEGKLESNSAYLSAEKYNSIVKGVKAAKGGPGKDQRLKKKYALVNVNGEDRLIKPLKEGEAQMRFYVKNEDLYDRIRAEHEEAEHVGRNKMIPLLKKKYANVTQAKKKSKKRGIVTKPLVFSQMNDRAQVDLIDFQSHPDGEFKHIMTYQDHLTKFVVLKPMRTKTALEVANYLLDIFLTIGAPVILQSDNGREFVASWVEKLEEIFPELKIVHGTPRHSQSQGSVERANQTVQDRLTAWMLQHKTREWARGLPFVQFAMNKTWHEGMKMAPYAAMFGHEARLGLGSMFPLEDLKHLENERDLQEFLTTLHKKTDDQEAAAAADDDDGLLSDEVPEVEPSASPFGRQKGRGLPKSPPPVQSLGAVPKAKSKSKPVPPSQSPAIVQFDSSAFESSPVLSPARVQFESSPVLSPARVQFESSPVLSPARVQFESSPVLSPARVQFESSPVLSPARVQFESSPVLSPARVQFESSPVLSPARVQFESSPVLSPARVQFESSPVLSPARVQFESSPVLSLARVQFESSPVLSPARVQFESSPAQSSPEILSPPESFRSPVKTATPAHAGSILTAPYATLNDLPKTDSIAAAKLSLARPAQNAAPAVLIHADRSGSGPAPHPHFDKSTLVALRQWLEL